PFVAAFWGEAATKRGTPGGSAICRLREGEPLDPHFDRHAIAQILRRISDRDLHREDLGRALIGGLYVARRELCLRRDGMDGPREGRPIGEHDGRILPEPYMAQVGLG